MPTRMNNHELLGQSMIDSGNEFGPGTAYGKHQTQGQHSVLIIHSTSFNNSSQLLCANAPFPLA